VDASDDGRTLKSSDPTIFSPLFAASGSGNNRRACLSC
jgi:hypothetical protein